MTTLDWIFIAVLLGSMLLGAWRGLVYEVLSLLGWVVAFMVARTWAQEVAVWLPLDGWDSFAGGDALVEQVFLCDGSWLGAALYVPPGPEIVHGWWSGVLAGTVFPIGVRGWSFGTLSIINKAAQVRPPQASATIQPPWT